MAERTGIEPATSDVTGRRSNQLNYRSENLIIITRTIFFETLYIYNSEKIHPYLVGAEGLEPPTLAV